MRKKEAPVQSGAKRQAMATNPFGKNRTFNSIDTILYPKEKNKDDKRKTRRTMANQGEG